MIDLYQMLDLPRGAPPDAIRPAYKRAAKKAHPDKGGTPEAWRNVCTAVAVLSDPERRAHYDATGKIEEKPVDNREAKALEIAGNALDTVLRAIQQRRVRFEEFDLVHGAVIGLKSEIDQIEINMAETRAEAQKLREIAKRFHAKKGKSNRLSGIFEGRATHRDRGMAMAVETKADIERAIALLREHEFGYEDGGF